ncbi:MAG: radical SAM protein [Rickettsiales bacterium]|jgi:radical SAM protein with 4Fe4S-binding SPASM domain|nr:radical SAM protein [Rickettsiales bacterium]
MLIETKKCFYDVTFEHCQIEITGRCNMRCRHCRAWEEARVDLPLNDIENVLTFFKKEGDPERRVTVSGGEPFLNGDLVDIIGAIYGSGVNNIIITTNASLVTESVLEDLENLGVPNLSIQVSLDSPIESQHDEFRGYRGAYESATRVLKLVAKSPKLVSSMRVSLKPDRTDQIDNMVDLALAIGCQRIGIGSIIPVGRASDRSLCMSPTQKRAFIEKMSILRKKYLGQIDVTTEDPLKFVLEDFETWELGEVDITSDEIIGGCTAGITGFNVSSDGNITPCAVFLENITNIVNKTPEQIGEEYRNSELVKTLLERNLHGRCGTCKLKRICGGCRATAFGVTGDYQGSDTTCWRVANL